METQQDEENDKKAKTEISRLQAELSTKNAEIKNIMDLAGENNLEELKLKILGWNDGKLENLENLEWTITDLERKLMEKEEKFKESQDRSNTLEQGLRSSRGRIEELEQKVRNGVEQARLRQEIQELNVMLGKSQQEVKDKEHKINWLEVGADEQKSEIEKLWKRVTETSKLTFRVQDLEKALAQAVKESKAYARKLAQAEAQIQNNADARILEMVENRDGTPEEQNFKEIIQTQAKRINRLRREADEEYTKLQKKITELTAKLNNSQQIIQDRNLTISYLEVKAKEFKSQLRRAQEAQNAPEEDDELIDQLVELDMEQNEPEDYQEPELSPEERAMLIGQEPLIMKIQLEALRHMGRKIGLLEDELKFEKGRRERDSVLFRHQTDVIKEMERIVKENEDLIKTLEWKIEKLEEQVKKLMRAKVAAKYDSDSDISDASFLNPSVRSECSPSWEDFGGDGCATDNEFNGRSIFE